MHETTSASHVCGIEGYCSAIFEEMQGREL